MIKRLLQTLKYSTLLRIDIWFNPVHWKIINGYFRFEKLHKQIHTDDLNDIYILPFELNMSLQILGILIHFNINDT